MLMLISLAICGWGQNLNDALRFSENNYYGTARSIAIANAMTAIGGDLGSIGLNPAGAAVSNYNQLVISPSLTLNLNNTAYTSEAGKAFDKGISRSNKNFGLSNIGIVFNFKRHNSSIKNFTIGLIVNMNNNYSGDIFSKGQCGTSSLAGDLASLAYGIDKKEISDYDAYNNSNHSWESILAHRSGIISTLSGKIDDYMGVTELNMKAPDGKNNILLAGLLNQEYKLNRFGRKMDYIFNVGSINLRNKFYFGFNIGFTQINYSEDVNKVEMAGNPNDFVLKFTDDNTGLESQDYFTSLSYQSRYRASASGLYFKLGMIYKAFKGLRLGFAIESPTYYNINESWQSYAEVNYESEPKTKDETPLGSYKYFLSSPIRTNFGLAYTFGRLGFISADYELTNYGSIRYNDIENHGEAFDQTNQEIKDKLGLSHIFRLGLEFNVLPYLALRTGYNFKTSGLKNSSFKKDTQHSLSAGLGYSTKKHFFFDFATRVKFMPKEYLSIYGDYLRNGDTITTYSPEILLKSKMIDFIFTVGYRF